MAEENRQVPPQYDLDAKWDACLDLSLRRFVYSSLAGAFGGLLLFRSPVTRWASVAFGAGIGLGSAYTECSYIFEGSPKQFPSKTSVASAASSQEMAKIMEGEDKGEIVTFRRGRMKIETCERKRMDHFVGSNRWQM